MFSEGLHFSGCVLPFIWWKKHIRYICFKCFHNKLD